MYDMGSITGVSPSSFPAHWAVLIEQRLPVMHWSLVDEGFYIFPLTERIYHGTVRLYHGKTGTWYRSSTATFPFLCPISYSGSAGGIGTITHSSCGFQGGRCGGKAGRAGGRT